MRTWKICSLLLTAGIACGLAVVCELLAAEPSPPAEKGTLIVVDSMGKEQKLKAWQFVAGTRHLSWLAPPGPAKGPEEPEEEGKPRPAAKPKTPAGPEALELREENSTSFVNGILTLIPLERLAGIDYDNEKDTMSVRITTGEKAEGDKEAATVTLTGLTKFRAINKLTIEAEVDKGDAGIAEVKFLGGVPKGIRSVRFPAPKPPAAGPAGRPATVTVVDRQRKDAHKVADLQPLYKLGDGSERLLPTLLFKKTLKVDIAKVQKLRALESKDADGSEWEVTLKDGEEQTLTLLKTVPLDGKPATLEGLLGRVPAGYKLFPAHTISEVQFEDGKEDAKPGTEKQPQSR